MSDAAAGRVRHADADVAIVVVGYKSRPHLDDLLDSLEVSHYKKFQLIFIDNASHDGGVALVRQRCPQALVLELPDNRGFAAANNLGIELALELGFSYLFLLNPDTEIDPDCLTRLVAASTPDRVLQPLLLLHREGKRTELVNTAGNSLSFLGFSYCGSYKDEAALYTDEREIPLVSGAAMFFPAAILSAVGGFDADFFLYHEDVDLSWRCRLAGYALVLVPAARVWHKYSFSRNKGKFYYAERNRMAFMAKNYSAGLLAVLLPFALVNELLMLVYSLAAGWLPEKLRAYGGLLRMLPHVVAERRRVGRLRRRTDRQLRPWFSSAIGFSEVRLPLLGAYNAIASCYWSLVSQII